MLYFLGSLPHLLLGLLVILQSFLQLKHQTQMVLVGDPKVVEDHARVLRVVWILAHLRRLRLAPIMRQGLGIVSVRRDQPHLLRHPPSLLVRCDVWV